ncbi:ROK family protein [Siphonobacter sp. SORGH_AS_0500]|uniref:ROK family protein n=1 Tax=Siphonobacter sp. SORGH_AS_0500 TaxID=1864824 RepID=UPI002863BB04|nr:ROK family protein [Siphonobacter sp. SORGH_AS_0500]MDR6197673.1 glucokinase [Siphonobacter sp. SORGH_AS_0500]
MTIGVDLGGTNIRAGVVQAGELHTLRRHILKRKDSLTDTLAQLIDLIHPLCQYPVEGIGIGVPSVVDVQKGVVYQVANIPSWEEVPLKDILEKELNLPIWINNDVNCFILGEHQHGLARSTTSALGLCIGTGLGCGLILNGTLYTGANCGAGEIGMLSYLDQTLEYYCSGDFFTGRHATTALETFELATLGDRQALALWAAFGRHLAEAIKVILYAYDPEIIVMGGSISKAFSFFEPSMRVQLSGFSYRETLRRIRILPTENENSGVIGAAALGTLSVPRFS